MVDPSKLDTAEIPTWPELRDAPRRPFSTGLRVDVAALSHTGKVRTNNEDHYFVARVGRSMHTVLTNLPEGDVPARFDTAGYTMVVADGMGGAAAGEIASRMAISTLVNMILDVPDWIMKLDDATAPRIMERVANYYRRVDRALAEHAQSDPALSGMGTTMTVAYSVDKDLFIAHVGDSRLYLFRDRSLKQVTRDHTQAQVMIDAGLLTRDEVATTRLKHVLTNALGAGEQPGDVEMQRLQLQPGDRIVLCTDGLTDMLDDASIAKLLGELQPPASTCRSLIDTALDNGGRDNVTVIVADYVTPEENSA